MFCCTVVVNMLIKQLTLLSLVCFTVPSGAEYDRGLECHKSLVSILTVLSRMYHLVEMCIFRVICMFAYKLELEVHRGGDSYRLICTARWSQLEMGTRKCSGKPRWLTGYRAHHPLSADWSVNLWG
ncbi:hypothetical protein BsWGS_21690 [Bradybaena similaris]